MSLPDTKFFQLEIITHFMVMGIWVGEGSDRHFTFTDPQVLRRGISAAIGDLRAKPARGVGVELYVRDMDGKLVAHYTDTLDDNIWSLFHIED